MPTYEYACKSCGEHLEVVQSFKDDALTECPACGGPLRKVFGNIGIAFKGSGFYKTDSRSSGKSSSTKVGASADSGGGSESSTASSGSGDSTTKSDSSTKESAPSGSKDTTTSPSKSPSSPAAVA